MKRLLDMAPEDRPREKLARKVAGALSDREFLAILFGKETKDIDLLPLADRMLKVGQAVMISPLRKDRQRGESFGHPCYRAHHI